MTVGHFQVLKLTLQLTLLGNMRQYALQLNQLAYANYLMLPCSSYKSIKTNA